MSVRELRIEKTKDKDLYSISVDGIKSSAIITKGSFNTLTERFPGTNVSDEITSAVIHELHREFNLSSDEVAEYTRTIEYLLTN